MNGEIRNTPASDANSSEYEAPQVERVMEADELAREVHYAGFQVVSE
jgi:hypothetical protein